jgi:hypothetical protein
MKSTKEISDTYIKWMKRILIFTSIIFLFSLASESRFVDKIEAIWNIFCILTVFATAKLLIHHWVNQVRRGNVASPPDKNYVPGIDPYEDAINGHKIDGNWD